MHRTTVGNPEQSEENAVTELSDLVDLENGTVSASIFVDDDVYQSELKNIFGKCWLFLAHESMVPKAGDYVTTYMGEDPVMVVRQRDGSIAAFLNQCRHRGMRLCRTDGGNARAFSCTYHGWTYDQAGNLINVPHEDDGYRNQLRKDQWGLIRVPQVENYHGFVFGTWDVEAEPFLEYLGDMAWYLDSFVDRWPKSEVAGEAIRWTIQCNWKFASEQFASDIYHAETSHVSALMVQQEDALDADADFAPGVPGVQFSSPKGHGTGFFLEEVPDITVPGPAVEKYRQESRKREIERLGELRATKVRGYNTVFPNFSFLVGTNTMRVWHPKGPNALECWTWTLVDADAPDEVKDDWRRNALRTFSAAGIFEQEDGENWTEIQAVLSGWRARSNRLNISMGVGFAEDGAAQGFPGQINNTFSEHAARGFYGRWLELLEADDSAPVEKGIVR
jgi:phenylpropionate dioxygenase-like ring-hydroxylating dioxygenase large terminal subunit